MTAVTITHRFAPCALVLAVIVTLLLSPPRAHAQARARGGTRCTSHAAHAHPGGPSSSTSRHTSTGACVRAVAGGKRRHRHHRRHHHKHGGNKSARVNTTSSSAPVASSAPTCENGSDAVAAPDGTLSCNDGSEPTCPSGTVLVHPQGSATPICGVSLEPRSSESEQEEEEAEEAAASGA